MYGGLAVEIAFGGIIFSVFVVCAEHSCTFAGLWIDLIIHSFLVPLFHVTALGPYSVNGTTNSANGVYSISPLSRKLASTHLVIMFLLRVLFLFFLLPCLLLRLFPPSIPIASFFSPFSPDKSNPHPSSSSSSPSQKKTTLSAKKKKKKRKSHRCNKKGPPSSRRRKTESL